MQTLSVVKYLDIVEQMLFYCFHCSIFLPRNILLFHTRKEALHCTVVIRTACLAHAPSYVVLVQDLLILLTSVLASSVTVKDKLLRTSCPFLSHFSELCT